MGETWKSVVGLWNDLTRGQVASPSMAVVPAERCRPVATAGRLIAKDAGYFTLRVSEMYLEWNRVLWSEYDPLVVVVAEFYRGTDRVVVPSVIGPNLIQKHAAGDSPKYGVLLLDVPATGPHAYRGGGMDLSVALYRVKRADYARALLKMMEGISSSLGDLSGQMGPAVKTAGALLDGLQAFLNIADTMYLAGLRTSLPATTAGIFASGYLALVAPGPQAAPPLHVEDGRLKLSGENGLLPYRGSDFVLLNIGASEERGNESSLPFYALKVDALMALWDGEDGLKRSKANLITAYQQMRKSPDITVAEADRLFDLWLKEYQDEKRRLEKMRAMPIEEREQRREQDAESNSLADAANRIGL